MPTLIGAMRGLEAQHGADVLLALVIGESLLVEGFADQREHRAVATGGRLDDVREELLLGFLVEVFERLARAFLVDAEVVVGAVGHAFEFLDAEGELVFDVVGLLRVERALAIRHVEDVELLARDADFLVEREARLPATRR